jgi:RYK receptor-like tyrosine kinase
MTLYYEFCDSMSVMFCICRCRVRVHSVVLEGTFGRVYRGTYAEEDSVEEEVLVKTVTGRSQKYQIS